MKEIYEFPEFKLSIFDIEDIITDSTTQNPGGDDNEGDDFDGD